MNEDATRSTHSRLNRTADDEQLAEELTRIHEEVAGANKSANSRPLQILPDRLRDSGDGSADQLSSARRVMELLAAMRPGNNADQTMLDVDDETRSEEVGKTGSVQASNLEIPATIGRFEIRELLGHGGFGMVFRAHDHRLDRDVALKIPTANSLLNSESRQRFERECRAVASLNHPNIVPVFEVGSDGPVDYLASELVEGTDLANWVRTNGVSDALKTAQAMVKVAEAVQHAHSRGVVHRDLKPSNILLEAKNGLQSKIFDPDSIRITDFGLAKFCDEDASLTQAGSVLGTPAFAAPEQLRGEVDEYAAELADVYSLGAVLYFQLTGAAPFAADSILALIQKVQAEEPLHPQKTSASVPRDLAAICLKAMDKEPARRYPNAWEFRSDLERFLRDEPIVARPMTAAGKAVKWCRRNPVVSGLLAAVFVALIGGFSTTYYQWQVAQANLAEVTRQKDRSDILLQKAEDSIDAMLNTTARALKNIPSMTAVRREMLEEALTIQMSILDEAGSNDGAILETVESLGRVARIQQELGNYSEAIKSSKAAIELINEVEPKTPGLSLDASALYRRLTNLHVQLGDVDAALLASVRMEEMLEQIDDTELDVDETASLDLAKLKSQRVLGELAELNNRLEAAESCFERAVSIGEALCEIENSHQSEYQTELMSALNSLAIVRKATGNLDLAHVAFASSLDINARLMKGNQSDRELSEKFAASSHNFANLLFKQKRYGEAEVHYKKAIEVFSDLSIKYPSVYQYFHRLPSALSGLALVQKKSGDFAAARETTNKSIQLLQQSEEKFGETQGVLSSLAFSKRALATLDSSLKHYDAADVSFELAESATRKLVEAWPANPKYRYQLALTMGNEADSLITRGNFDAAADLLREAKLEAERSVELDPNRVQYQRSLSFLNGKLVEALIGGEQFAEVGKLMEQLVPASSSSETIMSVAQSASRGVEHHRNSIQGARLESSDPSRIDPIVDRVFSLLDAAVAKGFSPDDIDLTQFKAVSDDERFTLLLNSPE